jgi:hypothetical protein
MTKRKTQKRGATRSDIGRMQMAQMNARANRQHRRNLDV